MERRYVYLGDRMTRADLRGAACRAVLRPDGKCVRSKLGTMLVELADGTRHVVIARLLRRTDR